MTQKPETVSTQKPLLGQNLFKEFNMQNTTTPFPMSSRYSVRSPTGHRNGAIDKKIKLEQKRVKKITK